MALREIIGRRRLILSHGGTVPSMKRLFSIDSNDNPPDDIDDTNKLVSDVIDEEDSINEVKRKALEFVAMGFTEKQAAYLSPDPEKIRLPRLTRKEAGSYSRPDLVAQYVKELQQGMSLPPEKAMYNLDGAMPEILDPKCPEFDAMVQMKSDHPELTAVDIARRVGFEIVDTDVSNSVEPVDLTWTFRSVLVPLAAGDGHPVNDKVSCEFDISIFQKHYELSDDAITHIAQICDSRYNQSTGKVTLISDRFDSRHENQKRIEQIIADLVKEGRVAYPKKARKKIAPARKNNLDT